MKANMIACFCIVKEIDVFGNHCFPSVMIVAMAHLLEVESKYSSELSLNFCPFLFLMMFPWIFVLTFFDDVSFHFCPYLVLMMFPLIFVLTKC